MNHTQKALNDAAMINRERSLPPVLTRDLLETIMQNWIALGAKQVDGNLCCVIFHNRPGVYVNLSERELDTLIETCRKNCAANPNLWKL